MGFMIGLAIAIAGLTGYASHKQIKVIHEKTCHTAKPFPTCPLKGEPKWKNRVPNHSASLIR